MFGVQNELNQIRMCLNHSQSGIEQALADLENELCRWLDHPTPAARRKKLTEGLKELRWLLDQHFHRVSGEGYLERAVSIAPCLYPDMREIECCQCALLDRLDELIVLFEKQEECELDHFDFVNRFRALHQAILREEDEERRLIDRTL